MKQFLVFLLLLMGLWNLQSLLATDSLYLEEALQQKRIALQVRGKGGYNGECLVVRAKNLAQQPLVVTIPPGWVFASKDSSVQDLMHMAEMLLALAPGEVRQIFLRTMCTQPSNMSPGKGEEFLAGAMADAGMVRLAQLVARKGYHNSTAQAAVWTVADPSRAGILYGEDSVMVKELAGMVCEATGLPASAFDYRPRSHQITSINTSLDCIIPRHLQAARLAVYDEAGQVVQQYFEGKELERGFRQFRVGVFHTREAQTRLFLRLTEGEELVDEKEIFVSDTISALQRYHTEVVLTYEVPEPTSATIGIYDEADSLNFILAEGKMIQPGHHRSSFGFGTDLPKDKAFYLKVKAADGKVLAQALADPQGPRLERHEKRLEQGLMSFSLAEPLEDARLAIYDQNGAIVRVLFEHSRLYPGDKRYRYAFQHVMGPDARFYIRLENAEGMVVEELCVNCETKE